MQENKSSIDALYSILDNTTTYLTHNNKDYIILIKKQKNKDYCSFFLTDCSENFWLQKMDMHFCEKLKQDMNVKTKTQIFAKHFVDALGGEGGVKIQKIDNNQAKIVLKIKISEGLVINCPVVFTVCVQCKNNLEEFQKLNRSFFVQLYEAKDQQVLMLKEQIKRIENKGSEPKSVERNFIKNVFAIQKKPAPSIPSKNRDLIHPERKKRKKEGIKFIGMDGN